MALVSRDRLRAYDEEIALAVEETASDLGDGLLEFIALFRAAPTEDERSVWRDALADAYWAAAANGQEVCHALADELWRERALAEGIGRASPAAHAPMDRDEAMGRIRSVMACLFERGWDDGKVLGNLRATARSAVEAAPDAAMAENIARAAASQASLRYARVPADAEACGFCFMISSLGFAYTAEGASPNHPNHPNCRCRVVPGFDGQTAVEGFDFAAMRGRLGQCEATLGLPPSVVGEQRRKLVQAECETRDPGWLWFGDVPEVAYEKPRERMEPKERKAADALAGHGFRVVARDEDLTAPANIDFLIGGDLWELKSPGGGRHAVEDRVRDAVKKWRKLDLRDPRVVLSNSESGRPDDDVMAEFFMRLARCGCAEGLFISADGNAIRRWRHS